MTDKGNIIGYLETTNIKHHPNPSAISVMVNFICSHFHFSFDFVEGIVYDYIYGF